MGRTALSLGPIVVLARGVAFLLPVVVAGLYGASDAADSFFYAFAVTVLVLVVISNAFATALTPQLARVHRDSPDVLGPVAAQAATLGAGLSALGIVGVALPFPSVLAATAFSAETQQATAQMLWWLVPYSTLLGAMVVLRAAGEVLARFAWVAAAPLLRGSTTLMALYLLHSTLGLTALPTSMILGSVAELAYLAIVLTTSGLRLVPTMTLHPGVRSALAGAIPVLFAEAVVGVNMLIDKGMAGAMETGAVSLVEYADRVLLSPQVFGESTLLPVAFATWSHLGAAGDDRGFGTRVDQGLRLMAAAAAAPLAGVWIGRYVLVGLLYERGAFSPELTVRVGDLLGIYTIGLMAVLLAMLATRALVIQGRHRVIGGVGLAAVLLNLGLDWAALKAGELAWIAGSTAVVWWLATLAYLVALGRTLTPDWGLWGFGAAMAAIAVGIAAAVEWTVGPPTSLTDPVLWVAALPCVALLGASVWRLR